MGNIPARGRPAAGRGTRREVGLDRRRPRGGGLRDLGGRAQGRLPGIFRAPVHGPASTSAGAIVTRPPLCPMPRLTFSVTPDGLACDALIGVHRTVAVALHAAGQPIPAPVSGRALIDTGSNVTCVSGP